MHYLDRWTSLNMYCGAITAYLFIVLRKLVFLFSLNDLKPCGSSNFLIIILCTYSKDLRSFYVYGREGGWGWGVVIKNITFQSYFLVKE